MIKMRKHRRLLLTWGLACTLIAACVGVGVWGPALTLAFDGRSPEAAARHGLIDGWLGRVEHLQLHPIGSIPGAEVFVYAGDPRGTPTRSDPPTILGLIDVKPSLRGWYAHGIRTIEPATLATPNDVAVLTSSSYGGAEIVFGHTPTPNIATIESTFDNGQTLRTEPVNGMFGIIGADAGAACDVRLLDQMAHVLQHVDWGHCGS